MSPYLCHCEASAAGRSNPPMSRKIYHVYIMTNQTNRVLYTGVTGDLALRGQEHKRGEVEGFTKKYHVNKLVYAEPYDYVYDALQREKQIKAGSRKKKIDLIESMNPTWQDLYDTL